LTSSLACCLVVLFVERARVGEADEGTDRSFALDTYVHVLSASTHGTSWVLRVAGWLLRVRGRAHRTHTLHVAIQLAASLLSTCDRHILRAHGTHDVVRGRLRKQNILLRERVVVVPSQILRLLTPRDGRLQVLPLPFRAYGWLGLLSCQVRVTHAHIVD